MTGPDPAPTLVRAQGTFTLDQCAEALLECQRQIPLLEPGMGRALSLIWQWRAAYAVYMHA